MSKLFDMMVFDRIRFSMSQHISEEQHGFVAKKSTSTNLLLYSSEISRALEDGDETDSVYTDFSKAFDKVSHSLIMEKLEVMGFGGNLLNWLCSYLVERKYSVRFESSNTERFSLSGQMSSPRAAYFKGKKKSC